MKKIILFATFALAAQCLYAQHVTKGEIEFFKNPQEVYVPTKANEKARVDNVILMIGDGMGMGHVSASMYVNGGQLTMNGMGVCGWVKTQSASDFTTDSAASATAYATGHKTNNYSVSVDPEGRTLETVVEKIAPRGYSCGVVTTDFIGGATPAAFYAHSSDRGDDVKVWKDLIASHLSFFAGGSQEAYKELSDSLRSALEGNFKIVYDMNSEPDAAKVGYFPELNQITDMKAPERKDWLANATDFAISHLEKTSKKGFFLMVEGARIDKFSHKNDLNSVVLETLDFDKAVERAVRFAEKDGHTLVIVTSDHETGGLILRKAKGAKDKVNAVFSSTGHTPSLVPLFAYGPRAHSFSKVMGNNEVGQAVIDIFSSRK